MWSADAAAAAAVLLVMASQTTLVTPIGPPPIGVFTDIMLRFFIGDRGHLSRHGDLPGQIAFDSQKA